MPGDDHAADNDSGDDDDDDGLLSLDFLIAWILFSFIHMHFAILYLRVSDISRTSFPIISMSCQELPKYQLLFRT